MSTLDTVRTGTLSGASVDVPKTVVAEWTVGDRKVCLFQISDRLAFSTEGRTDRLTTFRPELCDIGYAINLIIMFRRTIAVNLEKEEPHSSCFLPKFCTVARDAPGMHVALFGRIDTRSSLAGEIKGMRWGIFDISRREEQVFEVKDAVAEEFIRHAPKTNAPHLVPHKKKDGEPILDENKQQVMLPANDHYAMTTYAKRFDVVLERDADVIRHVRLVRTSIFDRNVWLDERSWAITLVSLETATTSDLVTRGDRRSSHAMIAYEGVKKDNIKMRQFLSYIHIRARPKDLIEKITGQKAEVEILDDETQPHLKWKLLVGLTRLKPSADVERMIELATQNGNVDFSFLGAMESTTITGGGGLSVLAVAGLAVRCFTRATQIAYDALYRSLGTVPLITGGVTKVVNGAFKLSMASADEVLKQRMAVLARYETYEGSMTLSRYSLASYGAFGLFIMYLAYTVAKSRSNRQNCLDWTIRTASLGGIIIRDVPNTVITPNETMLYLRSHPSCIEVVQTNSEVGSSNAYLGSGEKDAI